MSNALVELRRIWLINSILDSLGLSPTLAEEARAAGLISGIVRDLTPLEYQPPAGRYGQLLRRVMGIFDRKQSRKVPIEQRIAAAKALGQAGDPRIDFNRDDYWVTIPAGKFWMGRQKNDKRKRNFDGEAYGGESPVHEVVLDAYRIARYPVTVSQFRQFVEYDGYDDEQWWIAGGFSKFEAPEDWDDQVPYPSRPVVGVSWYEAAAFSEWAGCRLPTEAEWERAARGRKGRKYPWGNESASSERLNYNVNVGSPTPVGVYPLGNTAEGICDMAGNVWDWCSDWYGKYTAGPVSNPRGPETASSRVFRGGCWANVAEVCRSACRSGGGPEVRNVNLGFRVATVPSGSSPSLRQQAEPDA